MDRGEKCRTYAKMGGAEVEIRLKETSAWTLRDLSAAEKAEIKKRPTHHFVKLRELRPTGKLLIKLVCDRMEKARKDEPGRPLEGRLNSIVELMYRIAYGVREVWAKQPALTRKFEEYPKSMQRHGPEQEREQEAIKENQRIEWFNRQLGAWKEAGQVRAFAAEIRQEAERRSVVIEPGSWLANWLAWMERRAKSLDPIPGLLAPRVDR
jgi:hypothetical protein